MHNILGMGLIGLGLGLIGSGILRRRNRMQDPVPAGHIRPEFAAMGEKIRPFILFAVGIFAFKITLLYFVFGGQSYLSPLDFSGILFVLAAYAGWLVMATKRRTVAETAREADVAGKRSAA